MDVNAPCHVLYQGESWWESDLLAVAKEYLSTSGFSSDSGSAGGAMVPAPPPLAVREWFIQEQVRSWLIAIFCRADPLRLMELDQVMQAGKVRCVILIVHVICCGRRRVVMDDRVPRSESCRGVMR